MATITPQLGSSICSLRRALRYTNGVLTGRASKSSSFRLRMAQNDQPIGCPRDSDQVPLISIELVSVHLDRRGRPAGLPPVFVCSIHGAKFVWTRFRRRRHAFGLLVYGPT